MYTELTELLDGIDSLFFKYAQITGALEYYFLTLERSDIQKLVSKTLSNHESEWKTINRYMVLDNQEIEWHPDTPVETILSQRNDIVGFIYGVILARMIGEFDYYLFNLLKNRRGIVSTNGSSWGKFSETFNLNLLTLNNGDFVFSILQERHKIEHNRAIIDDKFLKNMNLSGVFHKYSAGDSIQKSHLDILATHQAITSLAKEIDLVIG